MRKHSPVEQYSVDLLLAGLVFGEFNCPPLTATELADTAFKIVEQHSWMPHRKELLRHVIDGLRSVRVNAAVTAKLESWFPVRATLRASTIENMSEWPLTADVSDVLWRALHDEDASVQRSAARTLAQLGSGDKELGHRVGQLATIAVDPLVRAAAVECLFLGWPQLDKLDDIISSARINLSPELRLAAIMGKVKRGTHNEDDRDALLDLTGWSLHMHYQWHEDIRPTLLRGWPGDAKLKEIFLSIAKKNDEQHFGRDEALTFLILGYPQDDDVANLIVEKLGTDHGRIFLHESEIWSRIAVNFKDNQVLVAALDELFDSIDALGELSITQAVMVGHTPKGKSLLLSALNNKRGAQHPARALLEHWGMADHEVKEALTNLAFGPAEKATTIAHLLSYIIPDTDAHREKLLELLAELPTNQSYRLGWILKGLSEIEEVADDKDALGGSLQYLSRWPGEKGIWGGYVDLVGTIIRHFHRDRSVRDIAIEQLGDRDGNHPTVASAYGSDPAIRQAILKVLCPLPAELREVIATQLGSGSVQNEYALKMLSLYDWDPDPSTKTQASIEYYSRLREADLVTDEVLQTLRDTIIATGPDLPERRQAAFCGLVTLGRTDIAYDVWQAQENLTWYRVLDRDKFEQNIPLYRVVLQHWREINDTFGDQFQEWIVRNELGRVCKLQPKENGGYNQHSSIVLGQLLVTSSYSPILFESVEQPLHHVA